MMNMIHHFRAVVLVFLLFCAELATAVTFRSQELKALAGRAGITTAGLAEGYNYTQVGGRRVYVRVSGGRIDNIGYDLFSDMIRGDGSQRVLTDFLERYFLLLNYPPADHSVKHILRDDRFKFVYGSMATVATLHPGDGFGYSSDDKTYVATWTRNGQELLTVTFPMEYQLLMGVSKSEAEDGFEYELKHQQLTSREQKDPDVAALTPSAQPFYYTHEGGWYLKKNINASTYYCRKSDQRYQLVSDVSHPAETAANMMLSGDEPPAGISDLRIVEDCGYTSVDDEFRGELHNQFGLPPFPLLPTASLLCRLLNGWDFEEASALRQVEKSQLPMLFIHGDSDTFVPTEMVYRLYDAKPGKKELWVTRGSGHAQSYLDHREEYVRHVADFLNRSFQ